MSTQGTIYAVNAIAVLAVLAFVYFGKVPWTAAAAFVAALLVPSAPHIAVQRMIAKKEAKTP